MNPLISVIIPTYNRAYCIMDSINSVLSQTFTDFELIVVDDCSTDNTRDIVSNISDARVKYICCPQNLGAGGARNYGIRHSVGEIIAFHDSDDKWRPSKLQIQLDALYQNPSCRFCYCSVEYKLENIGSIILPNPDLTHEQTNGMIYSQMLYDNLVCAPALLFYRDSLKNIGEFDESLNALEDYDFAIRLSQKYKAVFVNEVLVDVSYTPNSVSKNSINYLNSSCKLLAKYKTDYIATGNLNHRLEIILRDSEAMGLKNEYIQILEKIMQL